MNKKSTTESQKRIRKFQMLLTITFVIIIIASILTVILNSLNKSSNVLKSKVSSLVSTIDVQMEINIDNYLKTIENTSTLIFMADPIYNDVVAYQYDPIKYSYDKYDKIQIQDAISDKLIELSLMENYSDFAICYSDNTTIGKISKGTDAVYGDELYSTMEKVVTRQRTHDGWFSTNEDEFVRLYYAKRLNENAIMVTSFYVTELESIFARSESMNSMTIRLVDSDYTMIYSTADGETGNPLNENIKALIEEQDSAIVTNNQYIVSVATCGDDWKIICSIPTSIVLAENAETRNYTLIIGFVAVLCSIIAVAVITRIVSEPIKDVVDVLDTKAGTDLLTKIFNKGTYESECVKTIAESNNKRYSFWIIDIDDFKNVNDTKGHAFGDKVISSVANILKNNAERMGIVGRIGGDEFSIMIEIPDYIKPDSERYKTFIEEIYSKIKEDVKNLSSEIGYDVTLSVGASCDGQNYDDLFKTADKALYSSKTSGKNRITLFEE